MTPPSRPLAALPPGTRVGDLTILRPIGAGGQSAAYLAAPPGPAALLVSALIRYGWKVPLPPLCLLPFAFCLCTLKLAPPPGAAALHTEHALLSKAGAAHPHLVALYSRRRPGVLRRDLGVATVATPAGPQPCHWLALAHVPGRPLAALIGALTPGQARTIIAQVAAALQHLHQTLGAAHLDVTPSNIIVNRAPSRLTPHAGFDRLGRRRYGLRLSKATPSHVRASRDPQATLIDLGAAERIGHTGRRHSYGTPPYLAPERRANPPAPPAPQADIYALGVLLASLVPPPARASTLDDLISLATLHNPAQRAAAIPTIGAFLEWFNRSESPMLHP